MNLEKHTKHIRMDELMGVLKLPDGCSDVRITCGLEVATVSWCLPVSAKSSPKKQQPQPKPAAPTPEPQAQEPAPEPKPEPKAKSKKEKSSD